MTIIIITYMEKMISKDMIGGPFSQIWLFDLGPKAVPFRPGGHNCNDLAMMNCNISSLYLTYLNGVQI